MVLKQWKLQDAKLHFSELVQGAMKDGPQELSGPKENLVNFFRNSPFYGVDLDLERSKDIPPQFLLTPEF